MQAQRAAPSSIALPQTPAIRVLLLEAGGPDTDEAIYIPAVLRGSNRSQYDWAYETVPQVGDGY